MEDMVDASSRPRARLTCMMDRRTMSSPRRGPDSSSTGRIRRFDTALGGACQSKGSPAATIGLCNPRPKPSPNQEIRPPSNKCVPGLHNLRCMSSHWRSRPRLVEGTRRVVNARARLRGPIRRAGSSTATAFLGRVPDACQAGSPNERQSILSLSLHLEDSSAAEAGSFYAGSLELVVRGPKNE
jgi:hypothetical protein